MGGALRGCWGGVYGGGGGRWEVRPPGAHPNKQSRSYEGPPPCRVVRSSSELRASDATPESYNHHHKPTVSPAPEAR